MRKSVKIKLYNFIRERAHKRIDKLYKKLSYHPALDQEKHIRKALKKQIEYANGLEDGYQRYFEN